MTSFWFWLEEETSNFTELTGFREVMKIGTGPCARPKEKQAADLEEILYIPASPSHSHYVWVL
jgi:hypothetical protein